MCQGRWDPDSLRPALSLGGQASAWEGLKSIVLGWIYLVAAHLPPWLAIWVVNRSWPVRRPVLDYVEFHLADHCNLNCAGCMHFSPYADHRLADIESVRRDFVRPGTFPKKKK